LSLLVGQTITSVLRSDPHTPPQDPGAVALAVATAITAQVRICSQSPNFIRSLALGRVDFLRLGFLSPGLHRCRPFSRSSSRFCLSGRCHYTHVSISRPVTHPIHKSLSEQLIPMLGLTALEHKLKPETTLEKIFFLVEYGFTKAHRPTSFVSACALASLVTLRMLKASLRRFKWITRVPEVLIVVIVSTSYDLCPLSVLSVAEYL
jgi:hypothetical protein